VPRTSKTGDKSSSSTTPAREKIETPSKAFAEPTEVLGDAKLSTSDKLRALDSLEQDARQLAVASGEGMSGGEETRLRSVLEAKRTLELPSEEVAFTVVNRAFQAALQRTLGTDTHALISRALEAIKEARDAIAREATAPAPPPGAPRPGSTEELREELDKEKLDPGG